MKLRFYKSKSFWLSVALCLLPILAGAVLYHRLPDTIAIHFDANFNPDNYGPKWQAVFLIPTFLLLMDVLVWFIMEADPKRAAIGGKIKAIARWMIPVLSCFIQSAMILYSIDSSVNLVRFLPLLIGLFLIIIGNYLPKCKQNYTTGIKLPWTLASEENWNRTHRLAGKLFIAAGFLMALFTFFHLPSYLIFVALILAAVVPAVYSYVLYRKNI